MDNGVLIPKNEDKSNPQDNPALDIFNLREKKTRRT
jgi:hypothetical protein